MQIPQTQLAGSYYGGKRSSLFWGIPPRRSWTMRCARIVRMLLLALAMLVLSCQRKTRHIEEATIDPNPSFQSTFASATKLEFSNRYADPPIPSIVVEDKAEISHFLNSIDFETHNKNEILVCMCAGDPVVNITLADGHTENFVLHHGSRVRWKTYESDLHMTDSSAAKFKEFLNRHGIVSD
jgi:hypothetical protein